MATDGEASGPDLRPVMESLQRRHDEIVLRIAQLRSRREQGKATVATVEAAFRLAFTAHEHTLEAHEAAVQGHLRAAEQHDAMAARYQRSGDTQAAEAEAGQAAAQRGLAERARQLREVEYEQFDRWLRHLTAALRAPEEAGRGDDDPSVRPA